MKSNYVLIGTAFVAGILLLKGCSHSNPLLKQPTKEVINFLNTASSQTKINDKETGNGSLYVGCVNDPKGEEHMKQYKLWFGGTDDDLEKNRKEFVKGCKHLFEGMVNFAQKDKKFKAFSNVTVSDLKDKNVIKKVQSE